MKLTYDPKHNVAYIGLREKREQVETIRVGEELNIDLAPDGTVYGIELLNAREQLASDTPAQVVVLNDASGKTSTLNLPV